MFLILMLGWLEVFFNLGHISQASVLVRLRCGRVSMILFRVIL